MDWDSGINFLIEILKMQGVRGMSLKQIAHMARTDASELDRHLRRKTGKTSKQIVNEGRKELVVEMLTKKRSKGYEIASALGFRNEQSFYRWVKRQFRKSFKNLAEELCSGTPPAEAVPEVERPDTSPPQKKSDKLNKDRCP